MDLNKILSVACDIAEFGVICVMGLVTISAIDKGGEVAHLAFDSGDYVGASIGMLVMLLPFSLMMICVFIWSATSKIISAIRGDDE